MGTKGKRDDTFRWSEDFIVDKLKKTFMPSARYTLDRICLFRWESDFAVKSKAGYWTEVEIKISVEDFRRDFSKKAEKHAVLCGLLTSPLKPNRFCYAVPENLVEKILPLVPEYAGLVGVPRWGDYLREVKAAPLLTKDKLTDEELALTDKFYFNYKSYKEKYNGYAEERNALKLEIENIKAEFKAVTGYSYKEYISDAL